MKLLSDWGFTWEGLRQGQKGEYWVVAQTLLFLIFIFLPVDRPWGFAALLAWQGWLWTVAGLIGLFGVILFSKAFLDLGQSLTPLPYPKEDSQLVRSGVYAIVRHPIYSGVILLALSWAIAQASLTHLVGALVFFIFFNAKASQEEKWLSQKYPEYPEYRQQVKKLIPWLY
jgi:protein-S-isoprenylcysteine O-methyltransferase Ste14